jgi:hypothetical protein
VKNLQYEIALSALERHPFTTTVEFVLLDNKPNGNNWLISDDEFENVKRTAIGMPVKMRFIEGVGVTDHPGAVPIGVIRDIKQVEYDEGRKTLVAEASLWNEEYPDEIQWLHDRYHEGTAPGISYEMGYKSHIMEGAIKRFKDVVALAATFVRAPSYGTRTHLIALASLEEEERNKQLIALAQNIVGAIEPPSIEGGNRMDEKELEELKKAHASQLAALEEQVKTVTTEKETILAEKETLAQENESLKQAAITEVRTRQYIEAGLTIPEDQAEAKKVLFASFSEPQWAAYLGDLTAVKKTVKAVVSPALEAIARASQENALPKVEYEETTLSEMKTAMRCLARPHSVE